MCPGSLGWGPGAFAESLPVTVMRLVVRAAQRNPGKTYCVPSRSKFMLPADLPSALGPEWECPVVQRKQRGLGAGEGSAQDPEAPTCQVWGKVCTSGL